MRRNLLAAGAATLALVGAHANEVSTSKFSASVGPDAFGFQDLALSGDGVALLGAPGVSAGSDLTINFAAEYDVDFVAAPGYQIQGFELVISIAGGIGPAYTGTIYGADTGPGSAYAAITTPLGQFEIDGLGGYGTFAQQTFTGSGAPEGLLQFAANAELFCVVPLAQCNDIYGLYSAIPAYAYVTSFTITPSLTAIPEPETPALLLAGLVPLILTRRRK